YLRFLQMSTEEKARARRFLFGTWVALLAGFLTHQAALAYIVALLGHLVWTCRREPWRRPRDIDLTVLALVAVLLVGTWYGWLIPRYGRQETFGNSPTSVQMRERWQHHSTWNNIGYIVASPFVNSFQTVVPLFLGAWAFEEGPP